MESKLLTKDNLDDVVHQYIKYYNECENGCWTYEKAHIRIHQVMTIEDSECRVLYDNNNLVGFYMGYYKQFDDLKAYFLEEIVIFSEYQNKGYGTAFLLELEKIVRNNGAQHIELISVKDEHHEHFYNKLGYYCANNLTMMGKHFS
ncbi:MAG: GNAT family N-acetyltransferase [Clostridia bacterium]|nr:GNAT family N-acetyltransferase [Clostridia bacterium]